MHQTWAHLLLGYEVMFICFSSVFSPSKPKKVALVQPAGMNPEHP